jgi:hypothetical protein
MGKPASPPLPHWLQRDDVGVKKEYEFVPKRQTISYGFLLAGQSKKGVFEWWSTYSDLTEMKQEVVIDYCILMKFPICLLLQGFRRTKSK